MITLSRSLLCNLLCTPQSPSQGEAHPSLKFYEETVESFLVKLLFSFPCSLATYLCSSAETPDGRQDVEAETTGKFGIPSYQKSLPSMRNFNFRLFFFNVFSKANITNPSYCTWYQSHRWPFRILVLEVYEKVGQHPATTRCHGVYL